MIFEQLYPGDEDYTAHFYDVLPAFRDHRYITVEGKPLFVIRMPLRMQHILWSYGMSWRKKTD